MNKPLPPSDEGGGFCAAKDGGREQESSKYKAYLSLSHLTATAPSSEGAKVVVSFYPTNKL